MQVHLERTQLNAFLLLKVTAPVEVIHQTWHRLGTYLQVEWGQLLTRVRNREMLLAEARDNMSFHFGALGVLWELNELTIQVQPHPPRPP